MTPQRQAFLLEDLQVLYDSGDFYKVYFTILQHEQSQKIYSFDNDNVNLLYLKLRSLIKLNFNNEVITEITNFFNSVINLSPIIKLKFITLYLIVLLNEGNFLQALGIICQGDFELQCVPVNPSLEDEKAIAYYYHMKGNFYYYRGELNQAIQFFKKALVIRESQQDLRSTGATINNIGSVYESLGEFELASKCYLECISLYQSINYEVGISISLSNLGMISLLIGELNEAFNYFNEALKLVKKLSNLENESDDSETINNKFLDQLFLNFEDHDFVGDLYSNLGKTLYKRGEISQSLNYFSRALYIFQKVKNIALLSDLYVHLLSIYLELGEKEQSIYYLSLLDQINTSESRTIQIRNKYAHALFSTHKKRFKNKSEAQEIFNEIINTENADWDIVINSMTLLSELLFEEFMFFEDTEILDEVKSIIDKLHTIAKDKKSFSLLTETFILKMKIAVVEGDLDKALIFLDQAYMTSSEKNLETLKQKVIIERARLEKDYQYWKDFLKTSSIKERLEKIEIMDYMTKIKNVISPFKD